MDLLYSTPLGLTFEYLSRWFYKETSLRDLFREFFEADRRNAGITYDAEEEDDKDEEYNFIVGKFYYFRMTILHFIDRYDFLVEY